MVHKILIIAIVVALVIGVVLTMYLPSLNSTATTQDSQSSADYSGPGAGCRVPAGYILIVGDLQGWNDSVDHLQKYPSAPWPVITAHLGDLMKIIVCNTDDYSPHGFAIDHYFDVGTAIMPHKSFAITFTTDQTGNFTMYCNIFCPVHPYMLSGLLMVEQ
jgi:hypothetical protein